jgi:hypothetical protein
MPVLHLNAFALILLHAAAWRLAWFQGMAPELPLMLYLRNRFLLDPTARDAPV